MALTHNNKTADQEPAWSDVDKTKLPRNAHADMGEPGKKSSWGFPHHFVRNGKVGTDNDGAEDVYTSGDMYLHEGGLDAAWAAAQGARSGEKASQEVIDHLKAHRRALGKEDDDEEGRAQERLVSHMQGPWAITRDGMAQVQAMFRDAEGKHGLMTQDGTRPQGTNLTTIRGDVAVINIVGPIFHYPNILTMIFGLPSTEQVAQEYRKALDNPDVSSIVLWIDSPGGQLGGISELAGQINKGKAKKKTVAYVGDLGASAAFWIAAATSEIVATDTAEIGSIGVVFGLRKSEEDDTIEIVSSQSPNKRPDPNTDAGMQQLQDRVDALSEVFVKAISEYRKMERQDVLSLKGDVAIAAMAIKVGLADRLGSLEGVIEELTSKKGAQSMDITAQNIKSEYPKVAEEIQGEAKSEGRKAQQEQDLALVETLLGTEAKEKVKSALDSGLTADQLKQAQTIVGGQAGSGSGSGSVGIRGDTV